MPNFVTSQITTPETVNPGECVEAIDLVINASGSLMLAVSLLVFTVGYLIGRHSQTVTG